MSLTNDEEMYWLQHIQQFVSRENVNNEVAIGTYGPTYLHLAARYNYAIVVKWLVEECGANVNMCDSIGETPLFDAVRHGNFNIVVQLTSYGAKAAIRNNTGDCPLNYILRNCDDHSDKNRPLIVHLIEHGAQLQLLFRPWIPYWIQKMIQGREICRKVCVTILGIRRFRHSVLDSNVRDITQMIAKRTWRTRLAEQWE